ncbi:PIN domain-containing protein [Corticibacterium sp. UT-5YL-CI-8]|nr:PIN domain-containing protein [Tianweitania sp. UT-5YL-CI-8]
MVGGYLIDTSVLSALAPARPTVSKDLADWMVEKGSKGKLFLSSVNIAEIESGIRKLHRTGGRARAENLQEWLNQLLRDFDSKILPFNTSSALLAGRMDDEATGKGRHPGFADIAIAATAAANALTVLTANERHFDVLGIDFVNPLFALPAE